MNALELYTLCSELKSRPETSLLKGYKIDLLEGLLSIKPMHKKSPFRDELLTFCHCHVSGAIELFGGITILEKVEPTSMGYIIGQIELSEILISSRSGNIILRDYVTQNVDAVLAASSLCFLRIIHALIEFEYEILVFNKKVDYCALAKVLGFLSDNPESEIFYHHYTGCEL